MSNSTRTTERIRGRTDAAALEVRDKLAAKKKRVANASKKRFAQLELARTLDRARVSVKAVVVAAPERDGTIKKLVQQALYAANDGVFVSCGPQVCADLYRASIEQNIEALMASRANYIALYRSSHQGEHDDKVMQDIVFGYAVRAEPLECALKQQWAATDPPGYDSYRAFREIIANLEKQPIEVARALARASSKQVATAQRADRIQLGFLEAASTERLLSNEESAEMGLLLREKAEKAEKLAADQIVRWRKQHAFCISSCTSLDEAMSRLDVEIATATALEIVDQEDVMRIQIRYESDVIQCAKVAEEENVGKTEEELASLRLARASQAEYNEHLYQLELNPKHIQMTTRAKACKKLRASVVEMDVRHRKHTERAVVLASKLM